METNVYNQKGEAHGSIKLPESVFGVPWNSDLVHQVVHSMLTNTREAIAHTKGRGEVRGGGKKPWKQKGTGRARHGSIRSPIWVGGGVAHGPTNEKNFTRKVNKKMKTKALFSLMSKKFSEGEVVFIDNVTVAGAKTKAARVVLNSLATIKGFEKLATKKHNAALIAVGEVTNETKRSFRNMGNLLLIESRNLNPIDVLKYKYLVIVNPEASLRVIESKQI
jgi:large subunit ribosomal protein L4